MKDVKMSSVWWSCLKTEITLFLKAKSLFQKNCVGLLCHGHSLYENSLLQICVLSIPSERELSEFRFVIWALVSELIDVLYFCFCCTGVSVWCTLTPASRAGGAGEGRMRYIRVPIKKHHWAKIILKSLSGRWFQTTPISCVEEHNMWWLRGVITRDRIGVA